MHKLLVALSAASAVALAAAPALGSGATVKVVDYKFKAKSVHVSKGGTVTWNWGGHDKHNVTFKSFHSKTQKTGSFRHTFTKAGTYSYHCTIHGKKFGMHGTITVG